MTIDVAASTAAQPTTPSEPVSGAVPGHAAGDTFGNLLLECLAPADLDRLTPHLESVSLPRHARLMMPGEQVEHVLFPEGATMIVSFGVMEDGRIGGTTLVTRTGAVGMVAAFGNGMSDVRASIIIPGPARRIGTAKLAELAEHSPGLRRMAGLYNQVLLNKAMQIAACNALHTVEQRVSTWILAAHDCVRNGGLDMADSALPLTQELLSTALGVQRTTITLVASRLQQAGLVRYARGRITVPDPEGLRRVACECHRTLTRVEDRLVPPPAESSEA